MTDIVDIAVPATVTLIVVVLIALKRLKARKPAQG